MRFPMKSIDLAAAFATAALVSSLTFGAAFAAPMPQAAGTTTPTVVTTMTPTTSSTATETPAATSTVAATATTAATGTPVATSTAVATSTTVPTATSTSTTTTLPSTGGTPVGLIGLVGVALAAAGVTIRRRSKS